MKMLLKQIFFLFYIIVILSFFYFIYKYIVCLDDGILRILAVIAASILASTGIYRTYLLTEENEKIKTKRELFDRRLPIIQNIEDIYDSCLKANESEILTQIKEFSEKFYLMNLLFTSEEVKMFDPFIDKVLNYQSSKNSKDIHKILYYYDEYLKFEIVEIMSIVEIQDDFTKKLNFWRNQKKRTNQ